MKRNLLGCGIVAGPLFITVSLTHTRYGFDLARHPISLLSLGSLGWVQIAGAGFPPGAPAGAPTMSWHGVLHEIGFILSFVAAIAACVVFARRYGALGRRGWMAVALAAALGAPVAVGWPDLNTLSVRLVIATAILFGFLTAVFAQMLKQGPTSLRKVVTTDRAESVQGSCL
jgi:hypothetical protein